MILDIPGTVNFSQVQVYNNELINYVVINRGFSRLYDNDVAIVTQLSSDIIEETDALSVEIVQTKNEVEQLVTDLEISISNIEQVSANTLDYSNWNTTYTRVNDNYEDWNTTHTIVQANSASWIAGAGGSTGPTELSALNDVNVGALGAGQDGYSLVWSFGTDQWVPSGIAGGTGGASTGDVSAIISAYDTANDWTETAGTFLPISGNINDASSLLNRTTSGDFVFEGDVNGYNYNSIWVNKDEGTDSADALNSSFYNPIATAAYGLANYDFFDTTATGNNLKQSATIFVNPAIDDLDADLANETLTVDGDAIGGVGGTINSLYLVLQYKASRDATFNMPDGGTTQLARISGCTFGWSDINEDNSYTTFDGFYISDSTFTGDANQKFLFKNCYIDLSTITVSTASEFHFDNSCTIDPSAIANLTVKNKGIPTYLSTGTDPSTISGSFAGFTGPYLYGDTLVQP